LRRENEKDGNVVNGFPGVGVGGFRLGGKEIYHTVVEVVRSAGKSEECRKHEKKKVNSSTSRNLRRFVQGR